MVMLAAATAAAAQTPAPPPPAAPRTALSGYMDFHFNKPEFKDGRLDFHRFVLLLTHSFSDHIRFVGELELEHALVEGSRKQASSSSNRRMSTSCSRGGSTCGRA